MLRGQLKPVSAEKGRFTDDKIEAMVSSDVGPIFAIVRDVLGDHSLQMALIERNHMIEKPTAPVSDPALSHSILPGASNRSS